MRNQNAKNIVLLTIIVLGLFFLSGFGCQKGEEPTTLTTPPVWVPPAPDAGVSQVPEGWERYTSNSLGLVVNYPPELYVREFTEPSNVIFFDEGPIPETLPPEPPYPIKLFVSDDNPMDVVALYENATPEQLDYNGITITKLIAYSELFDRNQITFIRPWQQRSIIIIADLEPAALEVKARNILASVKEVQ